MATVKKLIQSAPRMRGVTPVPNGPLVKKKGPTKGSTLKKGGKVKKAMLGTGMFSNNPIAKKANELRGVIGGAALGMPGIKPIVKDGGKIKLSAGGEKHVVYKKESATGVGKGKKGHIMVNHPTKDKGKWDTIDLTEKAKAKTVKQGVAATKKWHKEHPYKMKNGGSTPAWQRKEGKNPSGGLNAKGVASYRRANPGSKLKTAVTTKPSKLKKGSKAANRRKSFCARMSGMKKRLTSAKTANDPNSRINKSLRKWNC